jgi:hypothetical protein
MKIVAQKCPCCSAPIDLGFARITGECDFCHSKVYISSESDTQTTLNAEFMLTANPDKCHMPQTACREKPMRSTDDISAQSPESCPNLKSQAAQRLNAERAALPQSYEHLRQQAAHPPTFAECIAEGITDIVKLPFKVLGIVFDSNGDESLLGMRRTNRNRRRRW